jgi:hypothetical protein
MEVVNDFSASMYLPDGFSYNGTGILLLSYFSRIFTHQGTSGRINEG